MSTKTTFKRVALVAVAALGLGVLSVAPSSAAVINLSATTTTVANGTATTAVSDSTTAATVQVKFTANDADDSATITSYIASAPSTSTYAGRVTVQLVDTATSSANPFIAYGARGTAVAALAATSNVKNDSVTVVAAASGSAATYAANFAYYLETTTGLVAGTYVITSIITPFSNGEAGTSFTKDVSIVVSGVAAESTTPSSAYSVVYLAAGNTASPTADSSTVSAIATASTTVANLNILVRNALNGTQAGDTITATITGPGLFVSGNTKYKKLVEQQDINLAITGDGTAGVSTITVKYELTGQTFTKSMTFYAANATTITTSVRTPTLGVKTNTGAVGVTAVDVNGNAWTGTAYIVASSAADALIAGSTTPQACTAWSAANGIRCDVTAVAAGTAKFKVIDASTVAAAKATSAEFSLTVSTAPAATVKVEFDKATYGPYEKAVITVSVLDAAGSLMPSKNAWANLFATGGISSSQAFTGTSDTLTAVSVKTEDASSSTSGTVALKKVYTVYMPAQGDVVLSWTGGSDLPVAGQVKGSATASVVNSSVDAATDAANEATDAANAATDAALAAADAADAATAAAQDASDAVAALSASVSKLISSLRAQITSLTNLVIKIQKKVRA
jgi:trimeric autotransporter adhesin